MTVSSSAGGLFGGFLGWLARPGFFRLAVAGGEAVAKPAFPRLESAALVEVVSESIS